MALLLSQLVARVEQVRATSRRSAKVELLAGLLGARGPDLGLAALHLAGTLPQGRVGLAWRGIQAAMPEGPPFGEPLTLAEVDRAFAALAAEGGPGSAERRGQLLRGLLARADEPGRRFLAQLVLGELRQGALDGLVQEAVARAASLSPTTCGARPCSPRTWVPWPARRSRRGPRGWRASRCGAGAGGPDAGQPRGRRRGGPRAPGGGGLRVQARRRARTGPQGRRRGARLHPPAPGRDRPGPRGGRGDPRVARRRASWWSRARP